MSEADVTGRLLRTFTDVSWPHHLSVDSEGRVLVADRWNHRILLLSSELQLQRVLIHTDSQVKLPRPTQLCYDERSSRLYVVHRGTTRGMNAENVHHSDIHEPPDTISLFHLR